MATIPGHLRDALSRGRCILFLGAGASMDAVDEDGDALPHWGQLLGELLDRMQDSPSADPPEVVEELHTLLHYGELMMVAEWIDHRIGDFHFRNHMIQRLGTADHSRVHEILSSKPFRAVLTTNYDRLSEVHWERARRKPFVVVPQSTTAIATARDALDARRGLTPVIRAHGALNDPASLIFFPRSYREIMFRNEPFRQFMSTLFREFTVLFVGSSFRDPNFQSLLQWIYTVDVPPGVRSAHTDSPHRWRADAEESVHRGADRRRAA